MSSEIEKKTCEAGTLEAELRHLRSSWLWFFMLGVALIVCGLMALTFPFFTALSVVVILGTILMAAGVINIVAAFWAGKWSGFLLEMLIGLFYLLLGMKINDYRAETVVAITLLAAVLLIIAGLVRIVAALSLRLPQWGWFLLNGVVTLLCGVVIYRHFPESSLWVIGLIAGLELIFHGWTWIMLSLGIRCIRD
jgi:uncharacterized membrane protein HdeD (DUF308 family)